MNPQATKEFVDFCEDHIKHFNAIPLEFEDSDGNVYDMEECWLCAETLGLTNKIRNETPSP